jgi:hypothetical protein
MFRRGGMNESTKFLFGMGRESIAEIQDVL